MKITFDGGEIRIVDGSIAMTLDSDQSNELVELYLDDVCRICFCDLRTASICCECLKKAIEEHREELRGCIGKLGLYIGQLKYSLNTRIFDS